MQHFVRRGSARPDQQATDQRALVLGSSIIAGLDPQNMNETSTKVKPIRGGHISDVHRHCQSITGRHSDLVLVISGNDCSGKVDVDELLNDYNDLIDVAVSKTISSKSVKISSVCPREDSYTLERIDAFNAGLSVLCRDKGCTFIDNDGNFRTRDGSISACVLSNDGVHLTKVGSDLLSRNLGLGVRIPESKPRPARTHNKTNARHSQQHTAGVSRYEETWICTWAKKATSAADTRTTEEFESTPSQPSEQLWWRTSVRFLWGFWTSLCPMPLWVQGDMPQMPAQRS